MNEERVPVIGEFYKHFKDKLYQIREIAYYSENKEKMVVYQAMYGDFKVYVRPYDMFISEVDHVKYPEVKQKYRFEKVEIGGSKDEIESPKDEIENTKDEMGSTKVDISSTKNEIESIKVESPKSEKIDVYTDYDDEDQEGVVDPRLLQFLDAENFQEKLNVLSFLRDKMDDRLINDIAISLDITVGEGSMDKRFDSLRSCVQAHVKYECNRLR